MSWKKDSSWQEVILTRIEFSFVQNMLIFVIKLKANILSKIRIQALLHSVLPLLLEWPIYLNEWTLCMYNRMLPES